ncbi:MAG: NADH-quinone oxidoreductase subunit, partial [Mycobacterium sp.]|nr:NADH-quinone oxidoreductase subunit [Mycobacterium sp.]
MPLTPVLTKRFGTNQPWKIEKYERLDGYTGLRKALGMAPDELIALVKDSNLRGRGGAGFPAGMKWQFIPQGDGKPHYVVVNADEGEPGTCRDLPLMMNDPHSMIEGIIIACYAVRAEKAFVYIRGEAVHAIRRVTAAVEEARAAGYLGTNILGSGFNCEITVHSGAGAYICGEETAIFESIEGKRGEPRNKPPFPAQVGLFGKPTIVNNVETLANVLPIILDGAASYKRNGTEQSTGTRLFCLSGAVAKPGVYEVPCGTTLRALLELAGCVPPRL